jgi:hypothetical protein
MIIACCLTDICSSSLQLERYAVLQAYERLNFGKVEELRLIRSFLWLIKDNYK